MQKLKQSSYHLKAGKEKKVMKIRLKHFSTNFHTKMNDRVLVKADITDLYCASAANSVIGVAFYKWH